MPPYKRRVQPTPDQSRFHSTFFVSETPSSPLWEIAPKFRHLAKWAIPVAGKISSFLSGAKALLGRSDKSEQISESFGAGYDGVTVSMLLGSGKRSARSRAEIYEKWHYMLGDPVVSSAISLHVTQALGGHETSGNVIFIERNANVKAESQEGRYVEELKNDLTKLFNKIAIPVAFNAAGFGDGYARPYCREKVGLVDALVDDMVHPALVQPYEQGGATVGYVVSTGSKFTERLSIRQLVRMKMPRTHYVPQLRVIEKSLRVALTEDDLEQLPILPAMAGGAFLFPAEEPFDNLCSTLMGIVGQRIQGSNQEALLTINTSGMSKDQQKVSVKKIKDMLQSSKDRLAEHVSKNRPLLSRLIHIIPVSGEKQMTQVSDFGGAISGGNNITVEDVFLHARLMAGALGVDLAMLGFADQLAGGLGDGGFFRVSAQAAERSRAIRGALSTFFDDLVDLHTLAKYGWVFEDKERPYTIHFYGSISALETEKQQSREAAMNAGLALVGGLVQMKDLGLSADSVTMLLSKIMQLDEDQAISLAKDLASATPPDSAPEPV